MLNQNLVANILLGGAGGGFTYPYAIDYSCRFDGSAYMTRTPASAGDTQKFTLSFWLKLVDLSGYEDILTAGSGVNDQSVVEFHTSTRQLHVVHYSGSVDMNVSTDSIFRDTSGWGHFIVAVDTTQATPSDRVKIYFNGVETEYNNTTYPSQNFNTNFSSTDAHRIGTNNNVGGGSYLQGYLAELHFLDGIAASPSDFGETYEGVWVPKEYTGSYDTNGFYLDFADAADLGDDESGNGNDWTESGLTTSDQMTDTPTNNCCVLNALTGSGALSDGNLTMAVGERYGTFGVTSGKWAWKYSPTANGDAGVEEEDGTESSLTMTSGSEYEFFLDLDAGTLKYKEGGGSLTSIATGLSGLYFPQFEAPGTVEFHGFTPSESGYSTLETSNMAAPSVGTPEDIDQLYYQGVHTAATSAATSVDTGIAGLASKDFLLVIKNLDTAESWKWYDTKRGLDKRLESDTADAEATEASAITVSGSTLSIPDSILTDGDDYLVQVYVEAAGHFEIATYTGTGAAHAESHSLGVAPFMMALKDLSVGNNWLVYHEENGATKGLYLDTTAAVVTESTFFDDTAPTGMVFSVGSNDRSNRSGYNYVAYLWADSGLYKSIAYEGNANADGPFVCLDGRPQTQITKNADASGPWIQYTEAQETNNVMDDQLVLNANTAQTTGSEEVDMVSNGLKIRSADTAHNGSGNTIVGFAALGQSINNANAR